MTRIQDIAKANQRFMAGFDKIKIDTRWVSDVTKVHSSWLRSMPAIQEQISKLQATAKFSLSASSQMATVAERFHAGVDFAKLTRSFRFQDNLVAQVQERFDEMNKGYDVLALSVVPVESLTALPSFIIPSASREVLITGSTALELSVPDGEISDDNSAIVLSEVREEVSGVVDLLNRVNPALATAYRGAREALSSTNSDRKRHVLSSLREMWMHLLRQIAPDEKVIPWALGTSNDLLHDGRPTRKARILYVCRDINHGPFTAFVNADTGALVKLVELFNRVHELEPGLSDKQLNALLLRSDSWLTFIIRISQEV